MSDSEPKLSQDPSYWFVGAYWYDRDPRNQTDRFLSEGVWQNGFEDQLLEQVRSMRAGDRIAIKSTYTRKNNMPFDTRNQTVSVMAVKATGTISAGSDDGREVRVNWDAPPSQPREWYFYTQRSTIWEVRSGSWQADDLINFAFNGSSQDIDKFRNSPAWSERFGDTTSPFSWTPFYEDFATKLLEYRHKRGELAAGLEKIAAEVPELHYLHDKFSDGSNGFMRDICPFTVIGTFNRGITDANRIKIATRIGAFLGVESQLPKTFDGIPVLNNMNSWFFGYEKDRDVDDIENLWALFAAGIALAEDDSAEAQAVFVDSYDRAALQIGVGWTATMGLYWARPWAFLPLDGKTRPFLSEILGIKVEMKGPARRATASDYVMLMDVLSRRFQEPDYPVHSFPDVCLSAWLGGNPLPPPIPTPPLPAPAPPVALYRINDILSDGCFLDRSQLDALLLTLKEKQNLILQGAPGTGKTWLARRLAYALIGNKNRPDVVRVLQFHPSLSYEDFVRGWRPSGTGTLSLVDGPFMKMVQAAIDSPDTPHVVVIEEINRGNPAQIFGEMLTLIESGKRTPSEAVELSYARDDAERVHVPANLYIIGTMNIADRSIALVDLAFRRRFAFFDLEPALNEAWLTWVGENSSVEKSVLLQIQSRVLALNAKIASDHQLGSQFRIGHSYVTPALGLVISGGREWFQRVIDTEIRPLLDEYWFDSPKTVDDAIAILENGW